MKIKWPMKKDVVYKIVRVNENIIDKLKGRPCSKCGDPFNKEWNDLDNLHYYRHKLEERMVEETGEPVHYMNWTQTKTWLESLNDNG